MGAREHPAAGVDRPRASGEQRLVRAAGHRDAATTTAARGDRDELPIEVHVRPREVRELPRLEADLVVEDRDQRATPDARSAGPTPRDDVSAELVERRANGGPRVLDPRFGHPHRATLPEELDEVRPSDLVRRTPGRDEEPPHRRAVGASLVARDALHAELIGERAEEDLTRGLITCEVDDAEQATRPSRSEGGRREDRRHHATGEHGACHSPPSEGPEEYSRADDLRRPKFGREMNFGRSPDDHESRNYRTPRARDTHRAMAAPLAFTCTAELDLTPEQVAEQILDVDAWRSFRGWGPIPGIRAATFRRRTDAVTGSEIAVENDDGSRHVETITDWRPGEVITLRMAEFTPPLANLASHIVETWRFTPRAKGCHVARSFELHPKSTLGAVLLRGVAPMLEQATARHLRAMNTAGDT